MGDSRASRGLGAEADWVGRLGVGAWTDVAVALRTGADVVDRGQYIVVRTPSNRSYVWGNCIHVLEDADDAERWRAVFTEEFPDVGHVAIGLPRTPDAAAWPGLHVRVEDVLVRGSGSGRGAPPVSGEVEIRPLRQESDWAELVELLVEENARTEEFPQLGFRGFLERTFRARSRIALAEDGCFFGAWVDGRLVAHVGVIACGSVARYQWVVTHVDHRRRGLASALIEECSRWAFAHGCAQQVIMANAGSAAARLYESLGFVPGDPVAGVEHFE